MREHEDAIAAAAKAAPPVTATGMTLMGYGLADWVLLLTLVYTALQTAFLVIGFVQRKKRRRATDPET